MAITILMICLIVSFLYLSFPLDSAFMKKLLFLILFGNTIFAQQSSIKFGNNSMRFDLRDKAFFEGNQLFGANNGYHYASTGAQLMRSMKIFFGGIDASGQVRCNNWMDFFPGPYSSQQAYFNPSYLQKYANGIWTVNRSEIEYHIDNYMQAGYVIPNSIANWPAHGDTTLGVAFNLAPFVDVDGDGVYKPIHGDYPCVLGDYTAYIINTDFKTSNMLTGAHDLGVEMHTMVYQFDSEDYIDSTTFIQVRIINRGQHDFSTFKFGMFAFLQSINAYSDRAGSNPSENMVFAYSSNSTSGHAIGLKSLNNTMNVGGFIPIFESVNLPVDTLNPYNAPHFWNYLNARYRGGSPFIQGGNGFSGGAGAVNTPTNFLFDGDPNDPNSWTDFWPNGIFGQKRSLVVNEVSELLSGQEHVFDFALIVYASGLGLENVAGLFNYSQLVQQYYNQNLSEGICATQGTGVQDNIPPPLDLSPWMVPIKRIDGRGNMGKAIDLTEQSFSEALWGNQSVVPTYKANKAPIYVKIENPGAHALGRFELLFNEYSPSNINNATWTIFRYDINTDELLDFVDSETIIEIGDLQYIPQWGISVQVKQKDYFYLPNAIPISQNLSTNPIEVSIHYGTQQIGWLAGVNDVDAMHHQNWILSGTQDFYQFYSGSTSGYESECYQMNGKDPEKEWDGLLNGTVSHFGLLRRCGPGTPVGQNANLNILSAQDRAVIAQTPSVDLVFTHEKEKWTRCVVVEMCDDASISQGNAQKMKPRNRPSVDKNGYSAGQPEYNAAEGDLISPVGMGWFPGFAIDVETGKRLNVVFGENSFFGSQNGSDMLWNPTSQMYDQVGNPRFGGQHVVFVIGENINNSGMPIYDSCATFFNNISSTNNALNRDAWQSATWTMYPMLREGHTLLEEPVLIRMRVNKRYENFEITGVNEGKPAFEWNISSLLPANLSIDEALVPDAVIYPNPAQNHFFIQFQNMQPGVVRVYSTSGVLVHEQKVSVDEQLVQINTESLASGMYIVQIGEVIRRVVVE